MNHLPSAPRSGIPAPKRFSFAPIAAAVAAVLAAAASPSAMASHTAFLYDSEVPGFRNPEFCSFLY